MLGDLLALAEGTLLIAALLDAEADKLVDVVRLDKLGLAEVEELSAADVLTDVVPLLVVG